MRCRMDCHHVAAACDNAPHVRDAHAQPLRARPRPQCRQLRAADAAVAHRAHGVHVSAAASRSSTATRRYTWAETYARSRRLASALARAGIGTGDTVAVMLANTPEMIEAHFGVPMTRRRAQHAQHAPRRRGDRLHARARRGEGADHRHRVRADDRRARWRSSTAKPLVIDIVDALGPGGERARATSTTRHSSRAAIPTSRGSRPADEWDAISLNYTSGTTGNPKGVVYHHRGAYLNALSNIIDWGMPRHAVYLWTLPMFHCNGWCFPWTMAANAGTNVCLRKVEAKADLRRDPRRTRSRTTAARRSCTRC